MYRLWLLMAGHVFGQNLLLQPNRTGISEAGNTFDNITFISDNTIAKDAALQYRPDESVDTISSSIVSDDGSVFSNSGIMSDNTMSNNSSAQSPLLKSTETCSFLRNCHNRCPNIPLNLYDNMQASTQSKEVEKSRETGLVQVNHDDPTSFAGETSFKRESAQDKSSLPSCRGDNEETVDEMCYCDENCVRYGDCCVDVFNLCFNRTNPEEVESFIKETKNRLQLNISFIKSTDILSKNPQDIENYVDHFVTLFGDCQKVEHGTSMNMILISRCPDNFKDLSVKANCENSKSLFLPPVTANLRGVDVAFLNIYCALCHDINQSRLTAWLSNITCRTDASESNGASFTISDMDDLLKRNQCVVSFQTPPSSCKPRRCKYTQSYTTELKNTVEKQVNNGVCSPFDALLCETIYTPMYARKTETCDFCLDPTAQTRRRRRNAAGKLDCVKSKAPDVLVNEIKKGGILIIIDLSGTYSQENSKTTKYVCADDEVLDPFVFQCKRLLCSYGREPYRGNCIATNDAFIVDSSIQPFPDGWNLLFTSTIVINNTMIFCSDIEQYREGNGESMWDDLILQMTITHNLRETVNSPQLNNQSSSGENKWTCKENYQKTSGGYFGMLDMMITITHHTQMNLDLLGQIRKLARFLAADWVAGEEKSPFLITNIRRRYSESSKFCKDNSRLTRHSNFSFVEYKNDVYAVLNSTEIGLYYPFPNVGYEIWISSEGPTEFREAVLVCELGGIFAREICTLVSYHINETVQNGSYLMVIPSQKYYQEGDFEIRGDEVFICSDFKFDTRTEGVQQSKEYVIVSWVLTIVSIIFLFAMIVIYCMFPELCSLPGKMTASLAGTMMLTFLSNLFTLVELRHKYICPVAAALSHLVTLAQFGWMAAIAVNMAMCFGPCTLRAVKTDKNSKAFLCYNMAVWGVSAAVVATAVVLDLIHGEKPPSSNNVNATTTSNETITYEPTPDSSPGYPRYGYPFCTWFSGPLWSNLAFVFVPFCITYTISVVGFLITLVGIHRSSRCLQKLGNRSSDRTRCLIYLKLSTAMGFSWILSLLLLVFPGSSVLAYIYVCLVLLQGVLLFLAFMVNKRVYTLITTKVNGRKAASSKTQSANVESSK